MRAYAVFAGGGVKGAALAGCLAAAQNWGLDFRGYGGTSAGSIVAFLAAIGYRGREIGDLLIGKDFRDFLDDGGTQLDRLLRTSRQISFDGVAQCVASIPAIYSIYRPLRTQFGLYSGGRLTDYLWHLAKAKLNIAEADRSRFDFSYLQSREGPLLKIVATDISRRRAVLFPRDCDRYSGSVLDAVRASAGFPFAFAPVRIQDSYLADGGLASNLPSLLFDKESSETRFPTLAFDLVQDSRRNIASITDLMRESFFTCLEASDVLIRDLTTSVYHIPVRIPKAVSTLDFKINADAKTALFDTGYRQTDEFLSALEPLSLARGSALSLQAQLMTQYGDPKAYQPILNALVRDIEENTAAQNVRANIMLKTGRYEDGVETRIVVYQVGMDGDGDKALEMKEDAGCSGMAWVTRRPAIADLLQSAGNPEAWGMSRQLHSLVPERLRSMMSVPIPGRTGKLGEEGDAATAPIGTLSVDSLTVVDDTNWKEGDTINRPAAEIMTSWAYVVARVLS